MINTDDDNDMFEELVCELFNNGYDISIMSDNKEVSIFFPEGHGYSLTLRKSGKWSLQ